MNDDEKTYYNIKQENGKTIIEKQKVGNGNNDNDNDVVEEASIKEVDNAKKEKDVWYNIKQDNGSIVIEEKDKSNKYEPIIVEKEPSYKNVNKTYNQNYSKKKKNNSLVFIVIAVAIVSFVFMAIIFGNVSKYVMRNSNKKTRTFMIYMVGSDLETNGSHATYDLMDITSSHIDLNENNVVLMVGGSKKWHNFVNEKELSIYELTSSGFEKKKTFTQKNMGTNATLTNFLNYSYDNYPAQKYDMIFWDHGLGAAGIESDETTDDFITIYELDKSFANSPFKNEKMEVVIFNNCLSGNFHFADIMSKYSEYMVGSEEVMYVSSIINRLNFLEDVKPSDSGYDVGLHYIEESDASMKKINSRSYTKYDSTLSIIDLKNIDKLNNKINDFFSSIDIKDNYLNVARARMKTYTYASSMQSLYDTVDLYELVESLEPYSKDKTKAESLKKEIKNTVKYNSAFNFHSNGLSIYFPYYGTTDYVETHLYYFASLWNNSYTKFINDFYENASSTKRARRAVTGSEINYLTNNLNSKNKTISLKLTDEEKDIFQSANIYIFEKENDSYKLLLQSNDVKLDDNTLVYNHYGLLNIGTRNVSLVKDNNYKIYGSVNDSDIISDLQIENNNVTILDSVLDSGDSPSMGLIDIKDDDKVSFYSLKYKLEENGKLYEDWKEVIDKEKVDFNRSSDKFSIKEGSLKGYYVLMEMYDVHNDVFYSKLTKINK